MPKKRAFDRPLFAVVVILLGLGVVMVYSASAPDEVSGGGLAAFAKQGLAAALGLLAMAVAMHVDYLQLKRPAVLYGIVLGVLALLVAVLFASPLNNTTRWFFIGGISVQPSELAKIAVVLFVAYHLDRKAESVNQPAVLVPCVSFGLFCVVLILLQPDFGTAGLILGIAGLMLFYGGLAWRYALFASLISLPALWFLIVRVPYRLKRVLAHLNPESDPLGAGFQPLQSMIAVGSGGVPGLGLGQSVQKLHFLPFAESDFIYSILSEELGLFGSVGVLLLFLTLFWRGIRAGNRAPDEFGRFLAWGLSSLILVQALINISVSVALLPTTGMPLPLISYGGSSLVTTLLACGLVLNVSQHG